MDVSRAHEDFLRRKQELEALRRQRDQQAKEFSEFIRNYARKMHEDQDEDGDQ